MTPIEPVKIKTPIETIRPMTVGEWKPIAASELEFKAPLEPPPFF